MIARSAAAARPRAYPPEGAVLPITTDVGLRLFRVLKANTFRVTLVPLTEAETRLMAGALHAAAVAVGVERLAAGITAAATVAAMTRPWWRRWRGGGT